MLQRQYTSRFGSGDFVTPDSESPSQNLSALWCRSVPTACHNPLTGMFKGCTEPCTKVSWPLSRLSWLPQASLAGSQEMKEAIQDSFTVRVALAV